MDDAAFDRLISRAEDRIASLQKMLAGAQSDHGALQLAKAGFNIGDTVEWRGGLWVFEHTAYDNVWGCNCVRLRPAGQDPDSGTWEWTAIHTAIWAKNRANRFHRVDATDGRAR